MPPMQPRRLTALAATAALVLTCAALANKPPSNAGPAPADPPPVPKQRPTPTPAEARASRQIDARDKADLLRARYESTHKPGPVPDASAAEQFAQIVEAFRTAIDLDPSGPVATYCRQRLAGAYTYTGEFDAGMRFLIEAVNVAATPSDQISACHDAAYHALQAMHKPDEALRWFKRAESTLTQIENPEDRAKWQTAIAQGIARCDPQPRSGERQ